RARVERSYEKKIDRPDENIRAKDARNIEVVMDGEIGGGSGRLRGMDGSDRAFRERRVDEKLAKEAMEIDRFEREARTERVERANVREREVRAYGDRSRSRSRE
ncbi:MAG: hypothetical protein AAB250_19385, partial [Bdellovibrionota bacterium]